MHIYSHKVIILFTSSPTYLCIPFPKLFITSMPGRSYLASVKNNIILITSTTIILKLGHLTINTI